MKVIKKQNNSKMCVMCGLDNPAGVRAPFYTMEDGSVVTRFRYGEVHQSYPGRVHGGLIAAMLDELGGRALWAAEREEFLCGVTTSLETKYRKPVPYGVDLIGRGVIVKETGNFFTTECTLSDLAGNLLAGATIKYIKFPVGRVKAGLDAHEELCYFVEDGVTEIPIAGM